MLDVSINRKDKQLDEVIIDEGTTLLKSEDQIKIITNWSYKAKGHLILMAIGGIPGFISFFIVLFIDIFISLLVLIFVLAITIPLIPGYLFYKNRKTEWNLVKSTQLIIYKQISPHSKLLKKFNFSEVDSLLVKMEKGIGDPALKNQALYFILFKKRTKKIEIFTGYKRDCMKLGEIISNFLEKPLHEFNLKFLRYEKEKLSFSLEEKKL